MKLLKLFLTVLICISMHFGLQQKSVAQNRERVYLSVDGDTLSTAQVDSLRKAYGDQLAMETRVMDGKVFITLKKKDEKSEDDKGMKSFSFNNTENEDDTSGDNESGGITVTTKNKQQDKEKEKKAPRRVFLDLDGREISQEDFSELRKEQGNPPMQIGRQVVNGEVVMTFNLANSEDAKRIRNSIENMQVEFIDRWTGSEFTVPVMRDLEGNTYTSDNLAGKVVVMNFWFVECAPCIKEMPQLNELVSNYEGQDDVVFIAPSLSDAEKINKMLKNRPFDYSLIPDAGSYARKTLEIVSYPTHVIIDKNGIAQYISMGFEEGDDLVSKLTSEIEALR